jgi:hypothetical protein
VNLFADDTLLYIATDNLQDDVNKKNEDLASFSKWLGLNKRKLNIQKTKFNAIIPHCDYCSSILFLASLTNERSVSKTTSNLHDMLLYKMEKGHFILPNFRKTSTQNSLLYNGMKIYNKIRRLDEFQNIRPMNDFQKICLCYVKMNF